VVLDVLRSRSPDLAEGMIVDDLATTSYTVVISQPGMDRAFLHHTGANDSFRASDIRPETLRGAGWLHFGYPTLMKSMYADGGCEMEAIFRMARLQGLKTSLDMSKPDPASEAGRVDWTAWLKRVLPLVDVYLPSLDETRVMLGSDASPGELARRLQGWGAPIVALKLGDQGLYCRWNDRELRTSCFQVDVVGTTGSGDCTIAGFLAGLLYGLPPDEVMTMAVAVGACCCEAPDAVSGVRTWDETRARIAAGWAAMLPRGVRTPSS
jgi:sugar/nucleoside kinase (ribokinase family)